MKRVVQRSLAQRDIAQAFEHYLEEAGSEVATGFIRAMDECMSRIAKFPESGSPRHAGALGIPGLRFAPVEEFPYLAFYLVADAHLDVLRVLHRHRDIPALFTENFPSNP